jgi:hypothetical protein
MGLLNGIYYRTLLLNPIVGVFLCILIWFTNRPFIWWYDCFFFGVLLSSAFVAWLVSIATCRTIQFVIDSYSACRASISFDSLVGIAVFVLIPNVILYVATYIVFLVKGRE